MKFLLLALALILPVQAEDWKTVDGKNYVDVKVIKFDADTVTILDSDGGALVPLINLSPVLQARFHYDPIKAKIAADQRIKSDEANAKLLQAEMNLAVALKNAKIIREQAETQAPAIAAAAKVKAEADIKAATLARAIAADYAARQREITISFEPQSMESIGGG